MTLILEISGDPVKRAVRPIVVRNNFQEDFGHHTDKIRYLKG